MDITVTADDFGLTRHGTDDILETFDRGILTRVSVLPNGLAFEYAMSELAKRPRLELSVHFNLTEGRALSLHSEIPHLTNTDAYFRYGPMALLLHTLFMPVLRREIIHELRAQLARVRAAAQNRIFYIDAHQHVHMVPMVCDVLILLHREYPLAGMRLPYEPFFIPEIMPSFADFMRHIGLNILSRFNRRRVRRTGLIFNDFFIGTFMSGRLTLVSVGRALGEATRRGARSVEIGLHPGAVSPEELTKWSGDLAWHYSAWRAREKSLAQNDALRANENTLPSSMLQLVRFGVAGTIATATNLGCLYILTENAHWWYIFSAVGAYAVATTIGFGLQKWWTFSRRSIIHVSRELAWFILNNAFGAAVDAIGLYLLVTYVHLWYILAQCIVLAIIAAWNFGVYRSVIFRTSYEPHMD